MTPPATGRGGFGGCSGPARVVPGGLPDTHLLTAAVGVALPPQPLFLRLEEPPGLARGGCTWPNALCSRSQAQWDRAAKQPPSREGWGRHVVSALTGGQAPWGQLHPSGAGCVSLRKPCPSPGLLGTQGSRDSAGQVQGTEPRPCLARPRAAGGRRSPQLAPGRGASGAAGEVSGEARGDLGASRQPPEGPPALGRAFPVGADLPSEVASTGRTGRTNPGTAPGQRSGLASAAHLGLATSPGNEAEASWTRLPLPSVAGQEGGLRGPAPCAWTRGRTRLLHTATLPPAHTRRPAAARPLPGAHTGPSTRAQPHTRLHSCVSGPLSATLGTAAPQRSSSQLGRVTGTNTGVAGPGEAEAPRALPASSPIHPHAGLTAGTRDR